MGSFFDTILECVRLPKMARIRQTFPRPRLPDVREAVLAQLNRPEIKSTLKPGMRVAITAGSRGVANMALVLKTVVSFVKEAGCDPFLFPAMGSHGGATAEGQRAILECLGITEETVGAPIFCGTEVAELCRLPDGTPVCIDKFAAAADGIICVNRIKPHTAFRNAFESGLIKMSVIGMGKQVGAEKCHSRGWGFMAENIARIAEGVFRHANILFGLGLIENAYDETCKVEALLKDEFLEKEPALLSEARALMASLPFEQADMLVVDEIGKNISGDGMDPNITGTHFTPYAYGGPKTENVVVLDLTPESHGSGIGIGAATVTTRRFFNKMDFEQTYPNCLTSKVLEVCRIPLIAPTDRAAIACAVYACALADQNNLRIARIRNSLHVDELYVSEALWEEVRERPNIELLREPVEMRFDREGNLF